MSVLVVDVGSSSMRGILFAESGMEAGQRQIKYHPSYGEDGICVEQDPLEYKAALWEILEWASETARDEVQAVSLTSQRSSCICMDANKNPIGNAICWQDKRTIPVCKELEKHGTEIFEKSGAWVSPVFLGPKLTWIRQNRAEAYKRVWKFMTIADYLLFLLTGNACTDDTYAGRTHLMDLKTRAWDDELLALFSVEREKLCDIQPVGSCVGHLRPEVAMLTGMPGGIPIYSAGGDQQCALIGQGIFTQGDVSVTLGTGAFIAMQLEQLPEKRTEQVIYNTSAIGGEYVVEYGAATCCSALDWLMREFYSDMNYENLGAELVKSMPGASGCMALPYFQGRMAGDHNSSAKAIFAGVSLNSRRFDLLRALIEGIGIEICNGIDAMPVPAKRILINGGLTKTPEICRILADTLKQPVYVSRERDATALGAYIVAATAMGYFSDEESAYRIMRADPQTDVFMPRQENAFIYSRLREENHALYDRVYREAYESR